MPHPTSSGPWHYYLDTLPINNPTLDPFLGGTKWGSGPVGTGATVTFSFPGDDAKWNHHYGETNERHYEGGFDAHDRAQAIKALNAWSDVANISFKLVKDTPNNVGDIRFAYSTKVGDGGAAAWAYYPAESPRGGDVWIDPDYRPNQIVRQGGFGYFVLLHEIGHALGLSHPFDGPTTLPAEFDNFKYTVMSYTDHPYTDRNPTTPLLYDILALQFIYGANMSTRTGNSTYSFVATREHLMAIWDAGGSKDAINCSAQRVRCEIDLHDGAFSSIGSRTQGGLARDNVAIAFGAIIENAIGGSANDLIVGNDANNRLMGSAGRDRLKGEIGDDFLIGGAGNDTMLGGAGNDFFDGGTGQDRMFGATGNDVYVVRDKADEVIESSDTGTDDLVKADFSVNLNTYAGGYIEHVTLLGSSAVNATGNSVANTIRGSSGNNTLNGSDGDDTLVGNGGNDRLFGGNDSDNLNGGNGSDLLNGGAGVDMLTGGAGVDTFDYDSMSDAGDTITDFAVGAGGDVLDLSDLLDSLGYSGSDAFLDGYVEFEQSGSDTIVKIDADGGGDAWVTLATLTNASLTSSDTGNFLL